MPIVSSCTILCCMLFLVFFFIGLLVGSFLNVVIARLRTAETILGRSYCRSCRKGIAWYDNIPLLSYIILFGRCRYCRERISVRYFTVEAVTGVLFAAIAFRFLDPGSFVSWLETVLYLGMAAFAVVISMYDAKYFEIPMSIMWAMIVWILAGLVSVDFSTASAVGIAESRLHMGMVAGLAAFAFFHFLSAVSRERWMGYGDAYVAFAVGLALGVQTFWSIVAAFVLGAIYGIAAIFLDKKRLSSQVPFAPFLFLGWLAVLFFGEYLAAGLVILH